MTRAHFFVAAFVLAAAPVCARPVAIPKPMPPKRVLLDLGSIHLFRPPAAVPSPSDSTADLALGGRQPLTIPKIGVGPLHWVLGLDDDPRAGLSSYQLQGGDQLGSSVWEAERGKSAKLMFIWPTEK